MIPILLTLQLAASFTFAADQEIFFLTREVETSLPDGTSEMTTQNIWVGKNRVLIEQTENKFDWLYDLKLHMLTYIDHNRKIFFRSKLGRDKKLSRFSLHGLVKMNQGVLKKDQPLVIATGGVRTIAGYKCDGYKLNYPSKTGMSTFIWTTPWENTPMDVSSYRRVWYAVLGTAPPADVRNVLRQVLDDLAGMPVQVVTTIKMEGAVLRSTATIKNVEVHTGLEVNPDMLKIPDNYRMEDFDVEDSLDEDETPDEGGPL